MSLYKFLRPLFFHMDPEWIHRTTISTVGIVGGISPIRALLRYLFSVDDPRLRVEVGSLKFKNPVGLAGGFDKNGVAIEGLSTVGFGFLEVGSVSAYPSVGNTERPRLFRVIKDEAIVVFYGVPNEGSEVVARRFESTKLPIPVGINLVETNYGEKPENAGEVMDELILAVRPFLGLVDYVTLNLNCPNTTSGQSPFDSPDNLRLLLSRFLQYESMPPTFLKVVPTTDPIIIQETIEAMMPFPFVKGIIFGLPTGKPYKNLKTSDSILDRMPGTLCGKPTAEMINNAIKAWYPQLDHNRHIIVGTGGIFTAEDVYKKIRLGATLVQLYTALIYNGPGIVKNINQELCRLMDRDGIDQISELVGLDNSP